MKILIVEDDFDLNETIKEYLENFFEVECVFDGEEALSKAYENNYDVIVLDVKLPKRDGFSVAKKIRKFSKTPIIFLTSLDSEKDVEEGFLSGGDDYIRKPFSLKELKFRIEAILKRVYGDKKEIKVGEYIFDMDNNELRNEKEVIHLKPKLSKLLKLFIQNKNRVLSKEEIFNYLYDYDEIPNEMSLRTFINNLRHILGKDKIKTIKGIGYKFVS
jgi:DNA-binding response OmpR family regulator